MEKNATYEELKSLKRQVDIRVTQLKRLRDTFYQNINSGSKISVTIKGLYQRRFNIQDDLLKLLLEFDDSRNLENEIKLLEAYSKNITDIIDESNN